MDEKPVCGNYNPVTGKIEYEEVRTDVAFCGICKKPLKGKVDGLLCRGCLYEMTPLVQASTGRK